MNRRLKRNTVCSRIPWKVILLLPACSGVAMLAAASELASVDSISPANVLVPTPNAITPYAGVGIGYDDNVLRLQNAAAAQAMGLGGLSDTTRTEQVGLVLDQTISRQHLTANVNVVNVDYDRFVQLDHLDKNASASWNWHVGNHVEGNVGLSYSQGLTPFVDFHLLASNIRTQVNAYMDASWLFHPSWRVRAGLTHSDLTYDLASQTPGNNTQLQTELGIDYLAASGSTAGLQLRHTNADFPIPEQVGTMAVFNGYQQNELKAKIDWLLTGKTRLHFSGGWVSRTQNEFSVRNFSGMNARASADWSPTGKINVSAAVWREIGAVDDLSNVYSINHGASLASSWAYSEKVRLVAQLKYEKRDFSQSTADGTLGADAGDVSRNAALTIVYNPTKKWEFQLSGTRSTQTLASASGGSVSNALTFNTRYAF